VLFDTEEALNFKKWILSP